MVNKRIWLVLTLAIVLSASAWALAACGGGGGGADNGTKDAAAGGTLAVYIGDPSFIDPAMAFESEGIQVDQALFDGLTEYDIVTLELKPAVAESWKGNDDATVWTFKLKKGTKFHNGREVVAGDFKYGWERLSNPDLASNYGSLLNMIKGYQDYYDKKATEITGIKVVDDYTLEVTCTESCAELPFILAYSDCAPVPKEAVDANPEAYALKPVGNGPFMMAEDWKAGQYIKVIKNPDYYGEKPFIDGIDFKIYSDINTAWTDFQAGTLDWTQIPPGNYASSVATYGLSDDGYTANPNKQVQNGAELGSYELLFNVTDEVMSNVKLRRAISLCINRQAICDTVWEGTRKPADSIIPPGVPGYEVGQWQYCHYDLEAAKAMLADAGYPNGDGLPTLKLTFNTGAGHDDIMQLVKSDMEKIGIKTEFDTSDGPTYWSKIDADEFQVGRSGWSADYPTMDDFLSPVFYSTGGSNYTNYNVPAIDQAITDARAIVDTDKRIAATQKVVRQIGDDCPEAIIAAYSHERVTSARVHNLIYGPMTYLDFIHCWIAQ